MAKKTSRKLHPWETKLVPTSLWNDKSTRLKYMKWLGKKLGYKKRTDWYQLSAQDFRRNYGRSLITKIYKGDPYTAVKANFPNYEWSPWLFKKVLRRFWEVKKNRIAYLKWLGKRLKFNTPEAWYQIDGPHYHENNGCTLLQQHYNSLPQRGPIELFPRRTWYPWLFHRVPEGFWMKKSNRAFFLKWCSEQLGYESKSDWDQLMSDDLRATRGSSLLKLFSIRQIRREGKKACSY